MSTRNAHRIGDLATVQEAYALREKLLGNPRPGVHVGEGRHVALVASWDGTGETPAGWEREYSAIVQHPTDLALFATLCDDVVASARTDERGVRLTVQESTALANHLTAARTLASDWDGAARVESAARVR